MKWANNKEEITKGRIYLVTACIFMAYTTASLCATIYAIDFARIVLQVLLPNPIGLLLIAFIIALMNATPQTEYKTEKEEGKETIHWKEKPSIVGSFPTFLKIAGQCIIGFCLSVFLVAMWVFVHFAVSSAASDPNACIYAVIAHSMFVAFEVTFVVYLSICYLHGLE